MTLVRSILAALIAISLVVLPAAGQAVVAPSADQTTMIDQADMPCCHCCDTQADLKLTTCALKCIGVIGVVFPATTIAPLYLLAGVPLQLVDEPLREFLKAPPTHPPSA